MVITLERLNKIYSNEDNEEFVKLLSEYENEEIALKEKTKNEENKLKMKALNQSCKLIYEIINKEDISITLKDIKKIIDDRKIKEGEYPNKPIIKK